MILFLRGHIRNSFDDNNLYILLRNIIDIVPNIDIYIQTWNVIQSNLSWRILEANNEEVTQNTIKNYFRDLSTYIKHINILDDTKINLIGDLSGNITNTKAPKKGWKNMLYGICNELSYMKNENDPSTIVINTRFDILSNFVSFLDIEILDFICKNITFSDNIMKFINEEVRMGVDNIYIGKLDKMQEFLNYFYVNLDNILKKYQNIFHQELIFFYENDPSLVYIDNQSIEDSKMPSFTNTTENNIDIEFVTSPPLPIVTEVDKTKMPSFTIIKKTNMKYIVSNKNVIIPKAQPKPYKSVNINKPILINSKKKYGKIHLIQNTWDNFNI
jgi:hypothetical protein